MISNARPRASTQRKTGWSRRIAGARWPAFINKATRPLPRRCGPFILKPSRFCAWWTARRWRRTGRNSCGRWRRATFCFFARGGTIRSMTKSNAFTRKRTPAAAVRISVVDSRVRQSLLFARVDRSRRFRRAGKPGSTAGRDACRHGTGRCYADCFRVV